MIFPLKSTRWTREYFQNIWIASDSTSIFPAAEQLEANKIWKMCHRMKIRTDRSQHWSYLLFAPSLSQALHTLASTSRHSHNESHTMELDPSTEEPALCSSPWPSPEADLTISETSLGSPLLWSPHTFWSDSHLDSSPHKQASRSNTPRHFSYPPFAIKKPLIQHHHAKYLAFSMQP